jgi:mono/diheme cytochrome c family protein
VLQGWQAYNITSDQRTGVGAWSDAQLAEYLSTGHAEDRGSAAGPMAEVVENSLQYLSRQDVSALVAYLRTVPAQDAGIEAARASSLVSTAPDWTPNPRKSADGLGLRVFAGACAGCHLYDGQGRQLDHAALRGSESVNDPRGANLIQILLKGARYEIKEHWVFMPAFGDGYSDTELAAVANYSIEHFGAKVGRVTPSNIAKSRRD